MHQMKWSKLFWMAGASFVAMYILMYMMVDKLANVYPNLNEFYMAAVMTAAMVLIEIFVMHSMYKGKKWKTAIIAASALMLVIFFIFVRKQTAVSDREFLKSMIPHHGAAILMCNNARLEDPEIKKLCESITRSQQSEIDWMKAKLKD